MSDNPSLAERQASLLIESAVDYAVIGFDLQGVITSWNIGATNIMGWSSQEAVGQPARLFFTPEDIDARIPAAEMSAAIRNGRGIDERWHIRKDGSRFWANGEMMPLRRENGALEGFLKILRDRTEQHASFVALSQSEDRYRKLHDAIDDGFCLIEVRCDDASQPIDYRFLEVNAAFERQTGLADAAGAWVRDLVPDHEQHWFDTYARIARTGEPARFELPARALNRWYEVFAYRVGNPHDHVVAVLFSDITERRAHQARLKASEDHLRRLNATLRGNENNLRLLLDTIGEGFYAVDRDGLTTTCNAAFLRMMGFARAEEVIGRRLHDLIHHSRPDGSPYPESDCPIYRAARHGVAAHVRGEQFFPVGRDPVWVEYRATPIVQDGELQGAICTFEDVTGQRLQETAREQSEERRTALLQLGERLRSLHDLEAMAAVAAETVGRTLGPSAAGLGRIDTAGRTLVIDRDWTRDPACRLVGAHSMRNYGSYIDDLLASRMVAIGDVREDPRTSANAGAFEAPGVRALMNAPVVEQGRLAAIFCVVSDRPRQWSDEEIVFVREVAERTRLAIERQRAEQMLAYADRLRFGLADLGDRLRTIEDVDAMQAAAGEAIGIALGVDRVGYGAVSPDGREFVVPSDWAAPGFPSLAGSYRMDDYGLYAADLRAGDTVVIDDVRLDPRTAAHPEPLLAAAVGSLINHPIVEQGRTVAVLYVNNAGAREWREEEVDFLREAGDRLRQATERRRAEIGLRDLNARLENEVEIRTAERDQMWNTSPDLMVILSPEGVYQRVNPAWTTVLGYGPGELAGMHAVDLTHPDDRSETRSALDRARAGILPFFENRFRHRDGGYRWIQWVAAPGHKDIFATGRDITEARQAQERLAQAEGQLRQSQKMEAVGQLTGGLAHDFNNLLAGISGSLELMQARMRQGRVGDMERYVAVAQGATRRAAALTHRLLAFSRRQTLAPKPTDVNALVAGMHEMIQRTVGPTIPVGVASAPDLWTALVDPSQLENALLNLCINARDAMPDGGRITIETANRRLDESAARQLDMPAGHYLALSVTDTGTGMPPEVIARAFEPFFTTKPIGEGTGLGLSMIYGFAQQSGGQVRIHSSLGTGTTVHLYLPRHHGQAQQETRPAATGALVRSGQAATVLVVDDEPTVRMLVADILEDLGYTAIESGDSATGLKILQSDVRIDLLVTDVGLPGGMNGRQMADAGRVGRPDLKVLFVTGYAETAVLGNGCLAPGMEVLTKPFAIEAMAERIRAMVETGRRA